MDIRELLSDISKTTEKIDTLKKQRFDLQQQCLALCPIKIGDRVKGNSWAYKGKLFEVDVIKCVYTGERPNITTPIAFICTGNVINASGKPGKNSGERIVYAKDVLESIY